ncbi:MAG: FtsQ-type POTRA domain-containing protein [Candidatus Cybelea sp.]
MRVKVRRRKASAIARLKPFWIPIALIAVFVLAALSVGGTWSGFNPTQVAVSGNHRVSSAEILRHAEIPAHVSIWLQNTGAIASRIAAIPYVGAVRVHRVPPSAIRIVVVERVPFAVLRSPEGDAVVDRDLRVLEPATGDETLPIFVVESSADVTAGEYLRTRDTIELRDAYEAIAARRIIPLELRFDRFGGLVVTIQGGLRLLLGTQNDLGAKLTLADAILSQVVGHQRRVAAIDLRAPAAPVLVYR